MNIIIKSNYILPFFLFLIVIFLLTLFMITEIGVMERVCLPFLTTFLIATIIYLLLQAICKDKFISKIYLISVLMHYIFILFWDFLKYHLMGMSIPTDNIYIPFIIDNDGMRYHSAGVYLNNHFNFNYFTAKMSGGLFPKIIGVVYHYFGNNPFIISCINTTTAGFTAVLYYLIGKTTFDNINIAKMFALVSIANFSHIMNTSTLMRDNYIVLFMYLSLYFSYYFYKTKKLLPLVCTFISLYGLYLFREYAAFVTLFAIIFTFIYLNLTIRKNGNIIKSNILSIILIISAPLIILCLIILFTKMTLFFNIFSTTDLITIRETAYSGSSTDFAFDFMKLYKIFPLLPFVIGYICMFFSPFPWEWILVRRIIYVPDMLTLYCFLLSFFKNVKKILTEKQYFPVVFFFSIIFMFSIYCFTLGNSGSIHRLRGPFLAMIYLIAMVRPDKFLVKILNQIQKWRIV